MTYKDRVSHGSSQFCSKLAFENFYLHTTVLTARQEGGGQRRRGGGEREGRLREGTGECGGMGVGEKQVKDKFLKIQLYRCFIW